MKTISPPCEHAPWRIRAAYALLALGFCAAQWTSVVAAGPGATVKIPGGALTAREIVAKNVAARGGVDAWRNVQTMVWTGRLETSHGPAPSMPFLLDQKRPHKTRFELHAMTEHSVRVFDGEQGWKSRAGTGVPESVKPYSPEEVRFAKGERIIDPPLIDLDARHSTVTLTGVESIDGRDAYHLSVRLASGEREEVWVDKKTLLEVKVARITYGPDGSPRVVPMLYRDYQSFEGLKIPTTIQIGDGSTGTPDRMRIDHVALNLGLDDRLFVNPGNSRRSALTGGPRGAPGMPRLPAPTHEVQPNAQ
jgi:hypothetical protein